MHFLHLTLLYFTLSVFSSDLDLEYQPSSSANILGSIPIPIPIAIGIGIDSTRTVATNIIIQSRDGGQTWQDISQGLPGNEQPEGFFAGESEVYLRANNVLYRSKSDLKIPVWEEEILLDTRIATIAFNRSGVVAYNNEGQIYQKMSSAGIWLPVYANFKNQSVETIFETTDGTILVGCRNGLYKSVNRGQSWKQVHNQGWVMEIVESEGVLIATGEKGIMRSTDNGEHWVWVISEGGVGIDVESIDGGFAAISYNTTMKSRRIHISLDRGKTWKSIDEGLRPSLNISSIKQIGNYLICGHPDGIFRSSDMGETWTIVHSSVSEFKFRSPNISDSDFDKKVFTIHVSGKVLYAVLRPSGC